MSVNDKARYAALSGLSVPVVVTHKGRDKYGDVLILRVTSTPRGQRTYRQGDVLVVSADSVALSGR
jgi:hypothetical protein